MAKGIREKIKLVSSAGTGHFYTTTKNKRTFSSVYPTYCASRTGDWKGSMWKQYGGVLKTKNPAEAGFLYKEAKIIWF